MFTRECKKLPIDRGLLGQMSVCCALLFIIPIWSFGLLQTSTSVGAAIRLLEKAAECQKLLKWHEKLVKKAGLVSLPQCPAILPLATTPLQPCLCLPIAPVLLPPTHPYLNLV